MLELEQLHAHADTDDAKAAKAAQLGRATAMLMGVTLAQVRETWHTLHTLHPLQGDADGVTLAQVRETATLQE